jgi:hypothetical protein
MALGGLSKLPPEPKRPTSSAIGSGFTWLLVGIGVLAILFRIFKGMRMMVGGANRAVSALRERAEAPNASAFNASIDDRIAQAAAAYNSGAATQPGGFQSSYSAPRPSFGQASAPSFGKR